MGGVLLIRAGGETGVPDLSIKTVFKAWAVEEGKKVETDLHLQ